MASRNLSTAYLDQAAELKANPGQWSAYESKGHCVVLAGPGSGKTRTLVLKLARILAEDVEAPRGAACITYSQECARELTRRLDALGLRESQNLFIGTVHGFCLRHILAPYGRLAGLALPYPLTTATTRQIQAIEKRTGDALFGVKHPHKPIDLGRHRRSVLDRQSPAWTAEPELAAWAEAYETELHSAGLIDFDDLIIHGYRLIAENDWVLPLLKARFPVLVIDEYQDLGVALHRIVMRLAFEGDVRLFAVGDYDQTVYGFTGAEGGLLKQLADRADVEKVQLSLNYRSAARLVRASEWRWARSAAIGPAGLNGTPRSPSSNGPAAWRTKRTTRPRRSYQPRWSPNRAVAWAILPSSTGIIREEPSWPKPPRRQAYRSFAWIRPHPTKRLPSRVGSRTAPLGVPEAGGTADPG